MPQQTFDSIEKTKRCFEESFESGILYNRQTQDATHLMQIINTIQVTAGMKILDLGTGTGYLSFPVAEKYPDAQVTGLDIVEKALEKNRERAASDGLKNLHFISYSGMELPFENEQFDLVITRYALHHFPAIRDTFAEISRVLKPGGRFFLSDPAALHFPRMLLHIFTLFPTTIFSFTRTTRPYPSSPRPINSSRSSAISTLLFL